MDNSLGVLEFPSLTTLLSRKCAHVSQMQNQSSEKERTWAHVSQTGRGLGWAWKPGHHACFPRPSLSPGTPLPLQTETRHLSGFPDGQHNYSQQCCDFTTRVTTREPGSSNEKTHSKALKRDSGHEEMLWGEICKTQRTRCDLCIIVGFKVHCRLGNLEFSGCLYPQTQVQSRGACDGSCSWCEG